MSSTCFYLLWDFKKSIYARHLYFCVFPSYLVYLPRRTLAQVYRICSVSAVNNAKTIHSVHPPQTLHQRNTENYGPSANECWGLRSSPLSWLHFQPAYKRENLLPDKEVIRYIWNISLDTVKIFITNTVVLYPVSTQHYKHSYPSNYITTSHHLFLYSKGITMNKAWSFTLW